MKLKLGESHESELSKALWKMHLPNCVCDILFSGGGVNRSCPSCRFDKLDTDWH